MPAALMQRAPDALPAFAHMFIFSVSAVDRPRESRMSRTSGEERRQSRRFTSRGPAVHRYECCASSPITLAFEPVKRNGSKI